MKKLSAILLIVLAASLVLTACSNKAEKITVATDATFPPFESVNDQTKDLEGFDIDLMKAIAEKAKMDIEFVNLPFDPMLTGVAGCQYDIAIAAISITPKRQEEMLFSDPYIISGQIVVVNKKNTTIKGLADLKGLTVAAQLGTTGEIEAKNIEGVNYKPYDTYDLAFLDLANGQIDAVIADNPTAVGFIAMNPEKIMTVGEVFNSEPYGIAVCNKKATLLEKVNKALKDVTTDGVIDQLAEKWLTQ